MIKSIKVQINGNFWTIYIDNKQSAYGHLEDGGVYADRIEEWTIDQVFGMQIVDMVVNKLI